ncbi:MAG: ATP-binding cassette domain-containing protein [Lachnospira sp.]
MLKLNHLKKVYNKVETLTDVSYIFNKGQIYPILGPSGSGKTVLLECICGDMALDSGDVTTHKKAQIFYAAKQSVLPMYITGYEFISMLCDMNRKTHDPGYYCDRVHISKKVRDRLICNYSFEDKKRLQLAVAMIQKPYVIMFDEPLDYCSEEFTRQFIEILNEMKDEHIVIVTTCLLEVSRKLSCDTVVLHDGELNLVSKDTMAIPEIHKAILDILGEADNEII